MFANGADKSVGLGMSEKGWFALNTASSTRLIAVEIKFVEEFVERDCERLLIRCRPAHDLCERSRSAGV